MKQKGGSEWMNEKATAVQKSKENEHEKRRK